MWHAAAATIKYSGCRQYFLRLRLYCFEAGHCPWLAEGHCNFRLGLRVQIGEHRVLDARANRIEHVLSEARVVMRL